jgi:hypothetical protein
VTSDKSRPVVLIDQLRRRGPRATDNAGRSRASIQRPRRLQRVRDAPEAGRQGLSPSPLVATRLALPRLPRAAANTEMLGLDERRVYRRSVAASDDSELDGWAEQSTRQLTIAALETIELFGEDDADQAGRRWQQAWTALVASLRAPDGGLDSARLFVLIRQMSTDLAIRSTALAVQAGMSTPDWIRREYEEARVLEAFDPKTRATLLKQLRGHGTGGET